MSTNKEKNQKAKFEIYRFQLLPKDRYQITLYGDISSVEELIAKKNEIFYSVIKEIEQLQDARKHTLVFSIQHDSEDFILFKVAVNRTVTIETKDFSEEEVANWPSFYIGIWNSPDDQLIYIQKRNAAYQQTDTVANILEKSIADLLSKDQLTILIEPVFRKEDFWTIVSRHKGKLRDIKFELITPNMSNISGGLAEDLKNLAKETNTSRTNFGISAEQGASLKIDKKNDYIEGLVDYASKGGGKISLKVRGYKHRIRTSDSKTYIEIPEIDLRSQTPESIIRVLKALINV